MDVKEAEELGLMFNDELQDLIAKYMHKGLHQCFINDIMYTLRLSFHNICWTEVMRERNEKHN